MKTFVKNQKKLFCALLLIFVIGGYEKVGAQEIVVEGASIIAKLVWLLRNVESNNTYLFALDNDEVISTQELSFGGKRNVTIRLTGVAGNKVISLEGNGSIFIVGRDVTLILDNGITLKGVNDNNSALVNVVSGGRLIMNEGANITGNVNSGDGGGVRIEGGASFTMNNGVISGNTAKNGGGVSSYGVLTINGGEISDNTASESGGGIRAGGGVFISSIFSMNGGKVTRNKALDGGGIYSFANSPQEPREPNRNYRSSRLNAALAGGAYLPQLINVEISNNTASHRGGGGYILGSSNTIRDCEIFGNSAVTGGGLFVRGLTLETVKIFNNIATGEGGGITVYSESGSPIPLKMIDGEISGNRATNGGGVYLYRSLYEMKRGVKISGNIASNNGGGVYGSGLQMDGGVISGNVALSGGGVYGRSEHRIEKTGGIIYGYTEGDDDSNRATAGNNNGHAVFVNTDPVRRRESTAGFEDNLNSKVIGLAGGWGY